MVGNSGGGEHGHEKARVNDYYDDGDVHAGLLYVHDFLRVHIRCVLHLKGKTPCRIICGGTTFVYNRET